MSTYSKYLFTIGAALALTTTANAVITITAQEIGGDVFFQYSGSVNSTSFVEDGGFTGSRVIPSIGEISNISTNPRLHSTDLTVSGSLGAAVLSGPTSIIGDEFIIDNTYIGVNLSYISGSPLSGMLTFEETTLTAMGISPETVVAWDWGSGATADSANFSIVIPEPSAFATTFGVLVLGLALMRRRASR